MKAIVAGAVRLPLKAIDVEKVKHSLTVSYWQMGSEEVTHVPAYREEGGYLCVPRAFGLKSIAKYGLTADYRISSGTRMRFPHKVVHTGEYAYQNEFVSDILSCCGRHNDFIAQAATGKGKTVCALSVIQKLGCTAIVIVDQENLMTQWKEQCVKVLKLKPEQIGTVQGKTCDYKGKHVVIAMIQSLTQRKYPADFYDHFGVMVVDEVHTAGAPTFSQALLMFSAETRFGISATVDRRDALQKILHWNLGEVEVLLEDKHDTSYVYYLESDTVYSWYANISPKVGRMLTEVASDPARNLLLVEAILWLYYSGRDVLVISDRIEQLENLMAMCYYSGLPEDDLGLYCGFRNIRMYEKDPTPKRRPFGYLKGAEYTPVKFSMVRKRTPKKELEEILIRSKIIFATFGMFAKGVDVPRLSGGVDCTPRSKAQQVHGRILRKLDGKYVPIWVTVRDVNSYKLEHQFLQRVDEYTSSSAEIYKWKPSKGVRLADVRELRRELRGNIAELKALNITTCVDGNYTLVTPPTPTGPSKPRGTPTARNIR